MAKNLFSILNERIKDHGWSFAGRPPYESDESNDVDKTIDNNEAVPRTSNMPESDACPKEGGYYFIDGAERRLKIGYAESPEGSSYPLYVGDVVVCCGQLLNKSFHCFSRSHSLCYAFPVQLIDHADLIKESIEAFCKQLYITEEPIKEILYYKENPLEQIHYYMRGEEEEMLRNLLKSNEKNIYIFIDGHFPWNDKHNLEIGDDRRKELEGLKKLCFMNNVISIDKEFTYIKLKEKVKKEIKELQKKGSNKNSSTPISCGKKSIVLWYQKLRNDPMPREPSSDIVECAIPYNDGTQFDDKIAEWMDLLKRLSCPTCYGLERRWRTHVYPMYLTERCCKEIQISETLLKRLIYGG